MDLQPSYGQQDHREGLRWMWAGLAIMLVLIGIAAVLDALYHTSAVVAQPDYWAGIIWGIIGLIFASFWVFWIFGWALFWPRRYRYRWRYGYRDDAYYILRERYARGEITREQFEQMMQDLERHE